jgi:hypothetical protein
MNGEKWNTYGILVGNPEEPLGIPRSRWVDNIKIDFKDGVVWTGLIWLRIGTGGGFL